MKKIILSSIIALTTGAAMANDLPLKIFAGANVAMSGVVWEDNLSKTMKRELYTELSESNLGLGAEIGVKYAPDQIYNVGVTLAYDYMFNSNADIKYPAKEIIDEFETGFSVISGTFDNYIRFANGNNRRSDFVFGLGLANVTERIEIESWYLGNEKGDDDGTAVVFKFAYNQQMTDNIDFNFGLRLFIPTAEDSDCDGIYTFSAGVRYNF